MLISTAKEEEEEEEEEEEDSLPKSGDDIDFPDKPRFSANKRYWQMLHNVGEMKVST